MIDLGYWEIIDSSSITNFCVCVWFLSVISVLSNWTYVQFNWEKNANDFNHIIVNYCEKRLSELKTEANLIMIYFIETKTVSID